ncbi:MAG: hypothetical protein AB7L90_02230 [Hyphomicrobiaceae bacterium]
MSTSTFTMVHVVISLVGIVSGIIVAFGMLTGKHLGGLTGIFLATTVLTSVTGFLFKSTSFGASHVFGVISLVLLTLALIALYGRHLNGGWRSIYIATALASLYLNVFVGVVQAFQKIAVFQALAPTQAEMPFIVAQTVVLAIFLIVGWLVPKTFHPLAASTP